jgi:hypothetical protein
VVGARAATFACAAPDTKTKNGVAAAVVLESTPVRRQPFVRLETSRAAEATANSSSVPLQSHPRCADLPGTRQEEGKRGRH